MRNRGFTLVEVIVVAVIVALLGATATLLYSGYIKQAAQDTVEEMAKVAASSGKAFLMRTGEVPTEGQLNLFISETGRYLVDINPLDCTITIEDTKYQDNDGNNMSKTIEFK